MDIRDQTIGPYFKTKEITGAPVQEGLNKELGTSVLTEEHRPITM